MVCCEPANDDVLECTWCEGRLHGKCVKLSKEQCIILGNTIRNVVFFCTPCLETLPTALKFHDGLSSMNSRVTSIENSINETQHTENHLSTVSEEVKQFSKQHHEVVSQMSDLTARINQLVSHNNKIQNQIEDINTAIHKKSIAEVAQQSVSEVNANSPTSEIPSISTTLTILDELADRERRRKNLIVYNMPESSDSQSDQQKFKELCSTVFINVMTINLSKTVRLGRKTDTKHRPLLVCLDDMCVFEIQYCINLESSVTMINLKMCTLHLIGLNLKEKSTKNLLMN